jgi:HK97 family phage major capsid protein
MIAENRFPEEKNLHQLIRNHNLVSKAAVDVGTTLDSDYAAPLVYAQNLANEFIEFLRPQTILGRMPGLRRVPFNVRVPRQTNGGTAGWVGEGAPKGVTAIALDSVSLKYKKLATIAVISEELARFSTPSAEMIIRDTLAGAIIQQMDSDFINPANAGTTDVKPASITNSVTGIASSGTDETSVRRDVQAVFAPFIAANLSPANGVWVMSATNALALSLMINALGQPTFPTITMNGGTFWGMPVIVSEAVGNIVVLANASDIMLADDGQVTIDTSREASLQMDSAPTNPPVAATVFISLWQMNLLGIRAERQIDWVKARPAAVQYLSGVEWGNQPT